MKPADDLIRTSLTAFAMKAFAQHPGQELKPWPYVKYLAWHLQRVGSGALKRLVVTLPPRHGKTFLCSISFAAWLLAHDPAAKIMVVSYGQELADKIAFEIRSILQSLWFQRLFKTRLHKAKLNDLITTAGGGVRSVSLEGGVTGLGADFIIIDDPVQIKDYENEKQLEWVNALFDAEIRTRLNNPKKGAIVIVAHRLAENDLPGHVQEEGGWPVVRLPLIAPRSRTYKTDSGFVWPRRRGELLRPDAFTQRDIERLRRGKRPNFAALYQQNPGAADSFRIKREWIGAFTSAEVPIDTPVVLSIDPGQQGGPGHSFHVIQAWGVHNGRYLLLDQWRQQGGYRDFRAEVYRQIRRRRPSAILIEATGQGPALISEINRARGVEVVPITPSDDKATRLRRHRWAIRGGALMLPEHAAWREDYLNELALFPYDPFDDQVDATSQFLDWIVQNPVLTKRPARALAALKTAHGIRKEGSPEPAPAPSSTRQISGGVLAPRRRLLG
jgi:predicted phage terminase large subunit-like protein